MLRALRIKYGGLHSEAMQYLAIDPWLLEQTTVSALPSQLHCGGEEGRVSPARTEANPFTPSRKLN